MVKKFEDICELEELEKEGKTDVQLLDARGPPLYEKGHIPIAKNVFYKKMTNEANDTVKTPEEIK